MPEQYYPVLLMMGVAIILGIAILTVSWLLGDQKGGRVKTTTIESGVPMLDRSHKRLSIAFFLIAIDFIVFDIEAAFLYPWALIMREEGWPLFWAVMVFFALCAQCSSTLMVIKRETNSWFWPAFTFTYMTALAYVAALLVYQVGSRIG